MASATLLQFSDHHLKDGKGSISPAYPKIITNRSSFLLLGTELNYELPLFTLSRTSRVKFLMPAFYVCRHS